MSVMERATTVFTRNKTGLSREQNCAEMRLRDGMKYLRKTIKKVQKEMV